MSRLSVYTPVVAILNGGRLPSGILAEVKFDVTGIHGYLHTKFGEPTSTGGRVMAIYVFSKWQSAAILDFCGSKMWSYFCFRDVGISLWAKFCANMCNCDRVIVI